MMTYFIKIFGCQMNYSDAERIRTILKKYKMKKSASIEGADFVIFVTCGVRQSAEDRVYGRINNLRKYHPKKIIILTGCLAHRKDVRRRLKGKVDLFFPINDFNKFGNWIIKNCLEIGNWKLEIPAQKNYCQRFNDLYLSIKPQYKNNYQAFVPVMTGCDNFCSYCVVPYARGREYSRPSGEILKEVKALIRKEYKEIVLLGQNVNSYKSGKVDFPKLLKLIEAIPGNFWLTFLTSHPKDMSNKLIETIARSKKICEYISLPAQSGDNEILKKMNRHYTVKRFKNLVKKIRAAYKKYKPQITPSISTDIIVGFPGEKNMQFENTAKLLKETKFDMAYISQYSPRPETAAWRLKDNVSKKEKVRREKILTKILEKTALANNRKYVGKIVEVLVDRIVSSKYSGHNRTQKKVMFNSNKKITIGEFVKVEIIKAKTFGLEGKMN